MREIIDALLLTVIFVLFGGLVVFCGTGLIIVTLAWGDIAGIVYLVTMLFLICLLIRRFYKGEIQ